MCGIIGYVGKRNATPFLLEGLRALEYRGYDSAGMYVAGCGALKRAGKVAELAKIIPKDFYGTAGIAHTRWATHGPPTEVNAHPHTDLSSTVWIVHNGIIENHAELREELARGGAVFKSETDTEVLAALIGSLYTKETLLEDAVAAALRRVRGTHGLAVVSTREPEKIVAARLGSPLLLGVAEDGYYLASDATPLLPHTREVIYLDDGELALLTRSGYLVRQLAGTPISKSINHLEWDAESTQKKGYEHFMLKEMMEIPETIEHALRGRLDPNGRVVLGGLRDVLPQLAHTQRIVIAACGSAYYAGRVGQLLIEELAGIPVEVEIASELRYRRFTMNAADTVLLAVSQSGETLDTLEAIKEAKRHGVLTLGIVNAVGSTIARETTAGVYNHAGPEIGVASTKAFVSQLVVLALIALLLGNEHNRASETSARLAQEIALLPEKARATLARRAPIEKLARKYMEMKGAFFLGRKFECPIAYEGAIKLKEISYIHAEGYSAGEMKHGPIALIEPSFASIVLAPRDSMYEKTKSNIQEIKARGGKVIAITTDDAVEDISQLVDDVIPVPDAPEALLPILTVLPLQLFAYYTARAKGLPIDQPRNLAKSVTVE